MRGRTRLPVDHAASPSCRASSRVSVLPRSDLVSNHSPGSTRAASPVRNCSRDPCSILRGRGRSPVHSGSVTSGSPPDRPPRAQVRRSPRGSAVVSGRIAMKRHASVAALLTFVALLVLPASPADADEPGLVRNRAGDGAPFTMAVIPDTQEEVLAEGDRRLGNRLDWLIRRADPLDLRYVVQVGDLTDWGWLAPGQLTRA